jgi:hypothetical protein
MRSLTCLLESRVYSSKNLRSTVQKDFCNKIGTVRTAFSQLRLLSNLPHPSASGRVAVMLSSLRPAELRLPVFDLCILYFAEQDLRHLEGMSGLHSL